MAPTHGSSGNPRRSRTSSQGRFHRQGSHKPLLRNSVIWTSIIILAGMAARLLAWPPETGPDTWIFKFLNIKCPTEEMLRELESRHKGCEKRLEDFDEAKPNEYENGKGTHVLDELDWTDPSETDSPIDISNDILPDDTVKTTVVVEFVEDPPGATPPVKFRKRPANHNFIIPAAQRENTTFPGLVTCKATVDEWDAYMNGYKHGDLCPDDWLSVQRLIFAKDCFQIPPRDCFVPIPPNFEEPLPASKALWTDPSLNNIAWSHYTCDSFECLRSRIAGDCRQCFNWKTEATRWDWIEQRNLVLKDVLALKKDSLRLGLDVAGGSGSFAALLASHNITVITTGMNTGAPFLETMALRGLLALHIPMKARLPFFDRTFDIIHSQHAVQMLSLEDFEFLIFDWDRVLRPGGLIWLDRFYQPVKKMESFTDVVALLGYKRHSWKQWSKAGDTVKFTAILEKPLDPNERH